MEIIYRLCRWNRGESWNFQRKFFYNSPSLNELNKKLIPEIISKFPDTNKNSIIINNKIMDQISPNEFKAIEAKNKNDPFFYAIMSDSHL
jgi:hypothetical protein